jgi:hypothetical protein
MWWHHNPANTKDYEYFVRCVERFRKLLASPNPKLFVVGRINLETYDDAKLDEVVEFNKAFSKHTTNYRILVIVNVVKQAEQRYTITRREDGIDVLELYTLSDSDGLEFHDKKDNAYLDGILKKMYVLHEAPMVDEESEKKSISRVEIHVEKSLKESEETDEEYETDNFDKIKSTIIMWFAIVRLFFESLAKRIQEKTNSIWDSSLKYLKDVVSIRSPFAKTAKFPQ